MTSLKIIGKWGKKVRCLCKCGNIKLLYKDNLKRTKTCGCRNHHLSSTRFYHIWSNMKARCNNPKNPHYSRYGGRRIRVCRRWDNFRLFKEDMYSAYLSHVNKHGEKATTIERINNNRGYNSKNCVWATMKQQGVNKQNSHRLLFQGESLTFAQAAKKSGLNPVTLFRRIFHWGYSVEEAMTLRRWEKRI